MAVSAHNTQPFLGVEFEADAVQKKSAAEALGEVFYGDQGLCCGSEVAGFRFRDTGYGLAGFDNQLRTTGDHFSYALS